jgi:putative oxidoreductase
MLINDRVVALGHVAQATSRKEKDAMNAAKPAGPPALSQLPTHHSQHHDPDAAKLALAQEDESRREQMEKLIARHAYFYFGGRALIALVFITSAVAKIVWFDDTRNRMADVGLSGSSLLLMSATLIELVGGIMVGIGYKVRRAAAVLIAYVAAATLLILAYGTPELSRLFALAYLGFAGGLLMLVAHGPGTLSVEKLIDRRNALRGRA